MRFCVASGSGTEDAGSGRRSGGSHDPRSSLARTLYDGIRAGIVGRMAGAGQRGSDDAPAPPAPPQPQPPQPQPQPPQPPPRPQDEAWYAELLRVVRSLGADPPADGPEGQAGRTAWLAQAKGALDDLAARVQGADGTDWIRAQVAEIQRELDRQISGASESLGSALEGMLPRQLRREWLAECAQAGLDGDGDQPRAETAAVRVGPGISPAEARFRARRAEAMRASFAEYIGEPAASIDARDIPVIAVAGSGGGFRAMVATLGSYRAMHLAGLAPCVTYDAAVSGSAWAVAALHTYARGSPFVALASVREAMRSSVFSAQGLADFVRRRDAMAKRVFSEVAARCLPLLPPDPARGGGSGSGPGGGAPPLSAVELYGALLFRKLIVRHSSDGDMELDPRWVRLSAQRDAVDRGDAPMPIYTAVRHCGGAEPYEWFELGPYEVGSIDRGLWVPTWAFGRPGAEAHFGSVLGAAGSAFCASVRAMAMEVYTAAPAAVRAGLDAVLDRIEDGAAAAHPVPPYSVHNPFRGAAAAAAGDLAAAPLLSLMDAGLANNLPFAPLLRPARGVDVIVCLDASANIEIMPWFARAEAWAARHGARRWLWGARPWAADALRPSRAEAELARAATRGARSVREHTARQIKHTNLRCVTLDQPVAPSPLPPPPAAQPPLTVVYLPLLPNARFRDPAFDPAAAAWCATFNDRWSADQVDLLADLAAFNFAQEAERVRDAVATAYRRKRAHRLYSEGCAASGAGSARP